MATRSRTILRIQRTLRITLGWVLVALLAALFESNVLQQNGLPNELGVLMRAHVLRAILLGIAGGGLYMFVLRPRLRRLAFLPAFAVMATLVLATITLSNAVVPLIAAGNFSLTGMLARVCDLTFLGHFLFYALLLGITMIGVRLSDQYGSGGLPMLLGRYSKPRQEQRIFMFFDMRSSTRIAEELGHERYFNLLNDVYADITDPVIDTRGEIYQYVGDEVSVTWRLRRGVKDQRCLECFFRIREKLQQRASHYMGAYGLVPEFKAGLHCGAVTAGEVGLVKKEPIFSGDAVNTAARIQNSCNRLGVDILVSKDLLDLLRLPEERFTRKPMGEIALRGKKNPVGLWTIDRTEKGKTALTESVASGQ
ncbi:MAG: adenylate/guanylate cyclase domain-containing protein [Flavobacteriales bacterium]